jgi:hypothetical protein
MGAAAEAAPFAFAGPSTAPSPFSHFFYFEPSARSVSGRFRRSLSAFASLLDSFRAFLTDFAGSAMK